MLKNLEGGAEVTINHKPYGIGQVFKKGAVSIEFPLQLCPHFVSIFRVLGSGFWLGLGRA